MIYPETIFADLVWQVEAGADEALEDHAGFLHWKANSREPAGGQPTPQKSPVGAIPSFELRSVSASSEPKSTSKLQPPLVHVPVSAATLVELQSSLEAFDGCELKKTAMSLVFADGNPQADVMIIGDVPAEAEDRQGHPFAGETGQLLDKMLAAIGLDRTKVYLANLVFWRPPGNRSPSEVEVAACLPFTEQHIRLKAPKVILLLGSLATKTLLRTKEPFSKVRGHWSEYLVVGTTEAPVRIKCLPTYHPAYLLHQPAAKRLAWADLVNFNKELTKLSI